SSAALRLLTTLSENHREEHAFYDSLKAGIRHNRLQLIELLRLAGFSRSAWLELAAKSVATLAQLRFKASGLRTGHLGLLEALEALELGVQGQCLLWKTLKPLSAGIPAWREIDFDALLTAADSQKKSLEEHRFQAGMAALTSTER
ncbi:MAG: hypothetical protein JWL81_3140, partial [Verrucomicrobiales bacterium]|nr:hypothetical protein [Verrucomicrobiales bacterium]